MTKNLLLVLPVCAALLSGCATPSHPGANQIKPFTTDGCSLFPDGTFKDKAQWRDACIEHDIYYWQGGIKKDRKQADLQLRQSILEKTGDKHLAKAVYDAVRVWGSPVFPSWYRWGYGWTYGRGYSPLTEEEQRQVEESLRAYQLNQKPDCADCPPTE